MSLDLHETITTSAMSSHHQTLIQFFPSTIRAWNNLPNSLIEIDCLQHFISNLNQYL